MGGERGLPGGREANARVDKLGEILSHDVFRGDLLYDILPGLVLQALEFNLYKSFVIQVRHSEWNDPHLLC